MQRIRNFSIIAHVDHGKSTLADRLIQLCGGLEAREMQAQVLDSMDLERERGITIKAQSVSLHYTAQDGQRYQLNLIDTPGHVDFSYEVSRSLAACEGALLVVDASQGVEAQSVANCYTAVELGLRWCRSSTRSICPRPIRNACAREIEEIIGIDAHDAVARQRQDRRGGRGAARGDRQAHPAAARRPDGAAAGADHRFLVRQLPGRGLAGAGHERRAQAGREDPRHVHRPQPQIDQLGVFTPKSVGMRELGAGEVGFVVAGIKEIDGAPVGDTMTLEHRPAPRRCPGFKQMQPRVFAGVFPVNCRRLRELSRRAREAQAQRLGAALRAGSLRRRWGSVSAAGSSACCTWTSSRSGSSASTSSS